MSFCTECGTGTAGGCQVLPELQDCKPGPGGWGAQGEANDDPGWLRVGVDNLERSL